MYGERPRGFMGLRAVTPFGLVGLKLWQSIKYKYFKNYHKWKRES